MEVSGSLEKVIGGITFDSRQIRQGNLFVAVTGTHTDGHHFIKNAIDSGATAIVCQSMPEEIRPDISYVRVKDSTIALGIIASNYYDNPSSQIQLVGITGTNGKTTIATLLYKLFLALGYGAGLFSTIRNMVIEEEIPATHTTPDAIQLNRLLRYIADKGCTYCFMEVSSHAIDQNRIAGLKFAGGIFTNITHDHLDYHSTFQNYLQVKKKFFDSLPSDAFSLTNLDDRNGKLVVQNTKALVRTYALKSPADFKCKVIDNRLEGLHLQIDGNELYCRLIGYFNAYNITAVYGAARLLGQESSGILKILSNLDSIEGRFEYIRSKNNVTGIVDYAHTPDALINVLETINSIRTRNEKLITVVGAGGDRDKTKRPIMAKICGNKSDQVILTSDNPRSEDPEEIIAQMKEGIDPGDMRKFLFIVNRKEAIRTACALARPGDIILVAGKGHEKYQEIKGVRHPFDDRKILEEVL
jgi:UDP-N-acetylmuramoyl-L-alanyl-D-glutamate--2,6-diaminopimelate ligase